MRSVVTKPAMLNRDLYELLLDTNVAMLSAAFFYWSKPLAHKLNGWATSFYETFPKFKALPGSQNAGTERNYKIIYIWFRFCSAIPFVIAMISFILRSLR
jgi:hypothetical protein